MAALLPRHRLNGTGLGFSPFARHYSGNHCCFLLLRLLRCFSSAGSPLHQAGAALTRGGLPHSDTRGSRAVCASPRLFAACRVLPRLQKPRHPPCALVHFLRRARARLPPAHRAPLSLLLLLVVLCVPSRQRTAPVENVGVEPTTPCLQGRCSSQLSYAPERK